MKHSLTLALCLIAITAPLQAQVLGQGALPIKTIQPLNDITDRLQRDIRKQIQLPQQATGADALFEQIPDTNEIVAKLAAIEVFDKQNKPVLTEINVQHGWRAIQQEWLILLEESQLSQLRSLPVTLISESNLPHLKMLTVRIRVSKEFDDIPAMTNLIATLGADILERHHVYDVQAEEPVKASSNIKAESVVTKNVKAKSSSHASHLSIGLIDTAIDHQHAGFRGSDIHSKSFVEANMPEPTAHATAVLGRLIGKGESFAPLLSKAKIFSASVFYQKDAYSQSAPTLSLLKALEWMLANKVSVINMSLAGPPNALLETALQRVRAEGVAVIAASGNAGPASRPLFPAAYESVIAVSAVDQHQRIYRWANRGKHIDFVAHGVNVNTLRAGGGEGLESGTSMATPVITAALALRMKKHSLEESLASLRKEAQDLGEAGRDVIYGEGFIALAQ